MKLELIRQQLTDPTEMTLGELLVDGMHGGYTIEPPLEGRGMNAIAEGTYRIALSSSNEPGSLTPYVIGVPTCGAVPIGYKSKRTGDPRESFIRVAETHDRLESHSEEDYGVFADLMFALRVAHEKGITIEVRTAAAEVDVLADEPTAPVVARGSKKNLSTETKDAK